MRAIVTGSSGFIGSNVVKKLIQENWHVLGIDNHSDYYSEDLKLSRNNELSLLPNFEFEKIDISERAKLRELVINFRPDTIFHLAAQAGVRLPLSQLNKYVDSNLVGFSSMLQVAVAEKVPNFLYASSSSVYGEQAATPYSEDERNLCPSSFYGATKLSNEILAKSLIEHSNTKARGLRFFSVYGPKGRPDMAYFRIISKLIGNKKFDLYGDGSVQRDFTYIDDCVEMIYKLNQELISRHQGFHDLVNIGGGHPVSITELINLCSRYLGSTLVIEKLERDRSDVARTMADPTYLKNLVGSFPNTRIEEGIKQTIDWACNLPDKKKLDLWSNSTV